MKKNTSKNLKKQMTKRQRQKGITLIALVITVIVLLILAGTAITLSINGGNLFSKTNEAANEWNAAVAKEETAMKNILSVLDDLSPSPVTVSTEIPDKWKDSTNISKVATAGERTVPIPTGFVVSEIEGENTIAGGLVIYQLNSSATNAEANALTKVATETEQELAISNLNQFVWIPVDDINQMVMCKKNNLAYTDENQEEIPAKICNIVYDEENDKIKCTVHNSEDICGRLYTITNGDNQIVSVNGSNKKVYVRTQDFKENTQTWDTTSYREPDLVETKDIDANVTTASAGVANAEELRDQLEADFKVMAESVAKYGGFYIGRYEAGYDASSYTSVKGQTVMTAGSSSAKKWYGLYKHLNTTIGEVKSTMIWGCQYDQVMKFIGTQVQIGHTDRNLPGTGGSSDYRKSGATPKDVMKNIYDLEGNYIEWTAQASSTTIRVLRGGNCGYVESGSFLPASYGMDFDPARASTTSSSRPVLYL